MQSGAGNLARRHVTRQHCSVAPAPKLSGTLLLQYYYYYYYDSGVRCASDLECSVLKLVWIGDFFPQHWQRSSQAGGCALNSLDNSVSFLGDDAVTSCCLSSCCSSSASQFSASVTPAVDSTSASIPSSYTVKKVKPAYQGL